MKRQRYGIIAVCAGLLVLLSGALAGAMPIVTPTVTELEGGLFEYSYELSNPLGSAENLFDFGLFFEGQPLNVAAPPGWDHIEGLGFIDWFSPEPAFDLLAGATLGGFSFESLLGSGLITFITVGGDAVTGAVGIPIEGTTLGPSSAPVPEPASLLLLATGMAGLIPFTRFLRKAH
jgi:hypothetical protein